MIYRKFQDKQLSMLGFGTMRLPTNPDGSINEALTEEMVDRAIQSGINYFDTAYPYHDGHSELVIGRLLNKYLVSRRQIPRPSDHVKLRPEGYVRGTA